MNGNKIVICDIDGTIADLTHRLHYIQGETKDWDSFFAACGDDTPHEDVIDLVRLIPHDMPIYLFSGRSDTTRAATEAWLEQNNVPYDQLRMRKAGDYRPDYEVKADMLRGLTPDDVWFILDDRDQVVNMWRDKGFRVLQVADGKF
jgi:phosphoglycolate phosphatase-like HAD superfamily hydrolase